MAGICLGNLHPLACIDELMEFLIVCSQIDRFLWFRDNVFSGSLSSVLLSTTASPLRLGLVIPPRWKESHSHPNSLWLLHGGCDFPVVCYHVRTMQWKDEFRGQGAKTVSLQAPCATPHSEWVASSSGGSFWGNCQEMSCWALFWCCSPLGDSWFSISEPAPCPRALSCLWPKPREERRCWCFLDLNVGLALAIFHLSEEEKALSAGDLFCAKIAHFRNSVPTFISQVGSLIQLSFKREKVKSMQNLTFSQNFTE